MEQKPIFTVEGVTFVYVQYNNLILMSVTKRNSNVALMLVYLYKLVRYPCRWPIGTCGTCVYSVLHADTSALALTTGGATAEL